MSVEFKRARRRNSKLRLALCGPSGSGKTYSAILVALGLGGKIAMLDTEHRSGELYSDLGEYDTLQVSAPYTVKKYLDGIKAAEDQGYNVIIIDSLSHAWAGDGGLLDKQGKITESSRTGNSYTAWRTVTPEHNALVEAILQSPAHIIVCMRTKTEYVLQDDGKGKQAPKKVGMAPIQRDGIEYEFTICLDLAVGNLATASKDRTGIMRDRVEKLSAEFGQELRAWLESGADPGKDEYPQAKIDANLGAWVGMIESGATTGEQIAAKIEKQFTLTEAQRKQICDLGMPDRGPDSSDDTHEVSENYKQFVDCVTDPDYVNS